MGVYCRCPKTSRMRNGACKMRNLARKMNCASNPAPTWSRIRRTVLWEEIRTVSTVSPMCQVPMATTEAWRCVGMTRRQSQPTPVLQSDYRRLRFTSNTPDTRFPSCVTTKTSWLIFHELSPTHAPKILCANFTAE